MSAANANARACGLVLEAGQKAHAHGRADSRTPAHTARLASVRVVESLGPLAVVYVPRSAARADEKHRDRQVGDDGFHYFFSATRVNGVARMRVTSAFASRIALAR